MSPVSGSVISGMVSVQVEANDNVRVVRNELYVDGVKTASSTSAPFTVKWNSRKSAKGTHSLVCRAYDAAGNVGTSSTVTVNR
jgi:hypothetical protein